MLMLVNSSSCVQKWTLLVSICFRTKMAALGDQGHWDEVSLFSRWTAECVDVFSGRRATRSCLNGWWRSSTSWRTAWPSTCVDGDQVSQDYAVQTWQRSAKHYECITDPPMNELEFSVNMKKESPFRVLDSNDTFWFITGGKDRHIAGLYITCSPTLKAGCPQEKHYYFRPGDHLFLEKAKC